MWSKNNNLDQKPKKNSKKTKNWTKNQKKHRKKTKIWTKNQKNIEKKNKNFWSKVLVFQCFLLFLSSIFVFF